MNYLTRQEIKEKYGYNQYELQNLRKNGKVRFLESPLMYCEEDIIKADKEDFVYKTILRSRSFNLGKYCDTAEIEDYMKTFGKEFRRVLFGMLKGKFKMSLNEYSKYGPFNSYDNRSLYMLAQGEYSRYMTQWEEMKENFEKWKIGKSKKRINKKKLYLQRQFQKIRIKRKDFLYFIGDDDKINCRMKIENGYLYLPSSHGERRIKIYCGMNFPKGKQTVTIFRNKNGKIICNISYHVVKRKLKFKGACGLDINLKNISATIVDNNGCLRKRRTFKFKNIRNLRNKKVEIMKLLLKIKKWAGNYEFILEDLGLKDVKKGRETSNFFYKQIFDNSFMLKNVKFVNPAYTSFIGLTKYSNLGMSIKHGGGSQDHSAAYVIARRGLGFKEKLPKFNHTERMNNWKSWSYLKKNYGEDGTRKLFGF